MKYRKSAISPTGRSFISNPFERGGLFNLEKEMVLFLHKELEYKEEELKYSKVWRSIQPRIRIKSELPVGK